MTTTPTRPPKRIPWLRLLISLLAGAAGIWLITRDLQLSDIQQAFAQARSGYILLAAAVIISTIFTKTWRWQLLFIANGRTTDKEQSPNGPPPGSPPPGSPPSGGSPPPLSTLFWPLILGQFINAISPVRVGDLARVLALERETGIDKVRALSTLVVEKTLDIIILVLTLFLILPTVVLPESITRRGSSMAVMAAVVFLLLLIFAHQRERVVYLTKQLIRRLPGRLQRPIFHLIVAGLAGLAALRRPRHTLVLTLVSAGLMVLSILTPYILVHAFDIPLGLKEAALLHLVLIIGLIPASTPANVGIFEGLVAFMLYQFGLTDSATIISYAIVYHLVVVLPQIILGSLTVVRSNWRREKPGP
jgi:uncharacterized protein (TIRG00374 family)